jgi:hypothetical protein
MGAIVVVAAIAPADAAKLGGKVYFTTEHVKDQSPAALQKIFEKGSPKAEVKRDKSGHWVINIVAFFRKPSVQGPITVWLYDKADKQALKEKEPTHQFSVDSTPKDVFVHELDLDPDTGFRKEHTYLVMVGQLIAKKEKVYATGELKLLK